MSILKATFEDLSKILDLQKLAYLSEAKIHNNYSIQPLLQTLDELEKEYEKSIILKLLDDKNNEIIGSIRAYEENDRVFIGKLIVHPNYQNKGFGTNLLETIETFFPDKTYELFTSSKSDKNLYLYRKNGYKEFKRQKTPDNIELIFLEKKGNICMYKIRKMDIKDYMEIIDLWKNTKGMGLNENDDSKESIKIFLKKNPNTCFVAEENNGNIIGTIMGGNDGRRGHIYHLMVKPEYRKNGIAKYLLEETERSLKKEGIRKIFLVVFKENEIGNNFWENNGYKIRGDLNYRDKILQ